jgi:DNA-binding MarR family transcriptional regulator
MNINPSGGATLVQRASVDEMASACLMGRVRILSRVLTGLYDEELRPFGIKGSQLNLLVVIAKQGPIRRIDIGSLMQLEPSTLTRNLQVMLKNRWVDEVDDGQDARGLPLVATATGRSLLERVGPAWQRAQQQAHRLLGTDGSTLVLKVSNSLMDFPNR